MRALESFVLITALVAIATCLTDVCSAQEAPTSAELLATYGRLKSYCDKGIVLGQLKSEFTRCAQRDGRFKQVSRVEDVRTRIDIVWSDGEFFHQVWGFDDAGTLQTNGYTETPLQMHYLGMGDDIFLIFVLRRFFPEATTRDKLEGILRLFSPVADATDTRFYVLERLDNSPNGARDGYSIRHRLWVSREDGLIRKYEMSSPFPPKYVVELNHVDTANAPSEDDLRHAAPIFARFSMSNHPRNFIVGLWLLALLTGSIVWLAPGLLKGQEFIKEYRKYAWRLYWTIVAVALVCLVALGVLSIGAGGHPPAIVGVFILGAYCAVGLIILACLVLGSYLAQPIANILRRPPQGR